MSMSFIVMLLMIIHLDSLAIATTSLQLMLPLHICSTILIKQTKPHGNKFQCTMSSRTVSARRWSYFQVEQLNLSLGNKGIISSTYHCNIAFIFDDIYPMNPLSVD